MNAWLHETSNCIGIEAQENRASMAARSVTYNGVGDRVTIINGDLRDPDVLPGRTFDLITGNINYCCGWEAMFAPNACILIFLSVIHDC